MYCSVLPVCAVMSVARSGTSRANAARGPAAATAAAAEAAETTATATTVTAGRQHRNADLIACKSSTLVTTLCMQLAGVCASNNVRHISVHTFMTMRQQVGVAHLLDWCCRALDPRNQGRVELTGCLTSRAAGTVRRVAAAACLAHLCGAGTTLRCAAGMIHRRVAGTILARRRRAAAPRRATGRAAGREPIRLRPRRGRLNTLSVPAI